uniref:Uncharacterized protein n=1 Tax=Pectinophora gossypiella TaxID=13191 RepID=A0A1E1VZL3_PECGO
MTFDLPGIYKPSNLLQYGSKNVEKGTLVFAIINITITCAALVTSIAGTIYWFATFILKDLIIGSEPTDDKFGEYIHYFFTYIFFGGIVILLVFSLIAFVFSVFLVHGVAKKKPQFLKAYFVYGVVVTIMCVMSAIAYLVLSSGGDPLTVAVVLLVCAVYSLILAMVRCTYKSYEQRRTFQYQDNLLVVATETPKRL